MAAYGASIQEVAKAVTDGFLTVESDDPSYDLLIYIAAAYGAAMRLKGQGADLGELAGKPLVTPALERAYREALYVRMKLPPESLDVSVITRLGRLVV